MAWPLDINRITCRGFNKSILPHLKKAVDNEQVEWINGKGSLFIDEGEGYFNWVGCEWRLQEIRELVTLVELIEGTITDTDLTYAVLRG